MVRRERRGWDLALRQPAPVGRNQDKAIISVVKQNAVHVVAGFFGRGGEGNLLNHLQQLLAVELDLPRRVIDRRHRRQLLDRHAGSW